MSLSNSTRQTLRRFYFRKLGEKDFCTWLWSKEAESQLDDTTYQDFIELDLENPQDFEAARSIVETVYGGSLFRDWAVEIAGEMLDGRVGLVEGCHILGDLYNQGYEAVPIEFVGYSSELKDDEGFLGHYRDRIIRDLERVRGL